jgi:hypothetical protein
MKRQEGTMQLRHIRPGSVDWQDAKVEDRDQDTARLSPEETIRLRRLSEDRRSEDRRVRKDQKSPQVELR